MQALDVRAHSTRIHYASIDPDLVSLVDDNQNGALFLNDRRLVLIGAIGIETALTDEARRHDKENKHDEDDVQHGRQIDFVFVFLSRHTCNVLAHTRLP